MRSSARPEHPRPEGDLCTGGKSAGSGRSCSTERAGAPRVTGSSEGRGKRARQPQRSVQGSLGLGKTMQLGILGLGRMGGNIARRLMQHGHEVVVYDRNPKPIDELAKDHATPAHGLKELVQQLKPPRAI